MTDDDCLTDEEFEDLAGCKRKSRKEIKKRDVEYKKEKKKSEKP